MNKLLASAKGPFFMPYVATLTPSNLAVHLCIAILAVTFISSMEYFFNGVHTCSSTNSPSPDL